MSKDQKGRLLSTTNNCLLEMFVQNSGLPLRHSLVQFYNQSQAMLDFMANKRGVAKRGVTGRILMVNAW